MSKRITIGEKVYSSNPTLGGKLPKNMQKIASGWFAPVAGTNDWIAKVPYIEIGNDKTYLSVDIVNQINDITIPKPASDTTPETN